MLLLDTDRVIDVLRGHAPAVAWLNSVKGQPIVLPGFVVMEVLQGCRNRVEQSRVEQVLAPLARAWPSSTDCDAALAAFGQFHLSHALGLLDTLMSHVAVSLGVPLHTFNQKHYAAIAALTTVQPYTRRHQRMQVRCRGPFVSTISASVRH